MSLPALSGVGRLTADPEIRWTASGMAVMTVNLAFNSRKRDESGQWVDDAVFFVRATAFKQLAENAGECLSRGMEVHVSGRLKTEQWNDRQTGDKRSAVSLLLDSIGPNLAFATAKVEKVGRGQDNGGGQQRRSSAPQDDPWADVPPPDEPPA